MARSRSRTTSASAAAPSTDRQGAILRRLAVALLCAKVALVPLVFDFTLDWPFTVTKALVSHALTYVLVGVIAALLVRYGRGFVTWSWIHVPVLGFLIASVAATVVAADQLLALYGAHSRMLGLGAVADWVILYFAVAVLVRTRVAAIAVIASALGASVAVLVYELVQILGKDPFRWDSDVTLRPFSTLGQATILAQYLTILAVGAVGVGLLAQSLPRVVRVLCLLLAGLLIAGAGATATRSAVVGLAAGSSVLVLLTWLLHPSRRVRLYCLAGIGLASVALAALLLLTPIGARLAATVETPRDAADEDVLARFDPSTDTRVALYQIAFQMVRERPVLGYGPDNFAVGVTRYRSSSEPWEVRQGLATSPHSWVAYAATSSGLLGLAAFAAIGPTAFVVAVRTGFRPLAVVGTAMLAAYLGTGLTTINDVGVDWLLWAGAGMVAAATTRSPVSSTDPRPPRSRRNAKVRPAAAVLQTRSVMGVALIAIGVALTLTVLDPWEASRAMRASQESRLKGRAAQAIDFAQSATRLDPGRPQYWQGLALAYTTAGRWADASAAFDRAAKLAPYDVRPISDQARAQLLLANSGDTAALARAVALADQGVRIDPNNPHPHLTRALVMQVTRNLPEALRSVERAVALDADSTNDRLYVTAMQVHIDAGRPADAVRIGRQGLFWLGREVISVPVRYELARALTAVGMPREALAELDLALAIQPSNTSIQLLRAEINALVQK